MESALFVLFVEIGQRGNIMGLQAVMAAKVSSEEVSARIMSMHADSADSALLTKTKETNAGIAA